MSTFFWSERRPLGIACTIFQLDVILRNYKDSGHPCEHFQPQNRTTSGLSCGDQHGPVRGAPLFSATNPTRPEISPPANEGRLIPPKSNRTSCHSLRSLVMFLFLTFVLFYFRLHTTGVSLIDRSERCYWLCATASRSLHKASIIIALRRLHVGQLDGDSFIVFWGYLIACLTYYRTGRCGP